MTVRFASILSLMLPAVLGTSACERRAEAPIDAPQSTPTTDPTAVQAEPTGKIIEIRMYTIDPEDSSRQHVFKPNVVSAEVGDTIRFIPSEVSHQSSSIETMLPEGVSGWEGAINEQVDYVLPKPGIYGYQCVPHYAAGMVGVVVVDGEGRNANLERALVARHPGLGNPKFVEVFDEARRQGLIE